MGAFRTFLAGPVRLGLAVLRRLGIDSRLLLDARGKVSGVTLLATPDEDWLIRGAIVRFDHGGVPVRMFVANDSDEVQRAHRKGGLYEPEELAIIAGAYTDGTFVDVGGNVGNHAIFAAQVLGAERVIVFEPEPRAAELCAINLALNRCDDRVELRPVGLSDAAGRARTGAVPANNLGAAWLADSADGPIALTTGDAALAGEDVGFVKIDTEGFELRVLAGLTATLSRCRPPVFVEVEDTNLAAARAFFAAQGYRVAEQFRRYEGVVNLLALPEDG